MRPNIRIDVGSLLRRLPILLLALAVSLFIGWWVVRSAAVNELWRKGGKDPITRVMAPEDPRVVSGFVNLELRTKMGIASPGTKRRARQALLYAPLMEEPFLLDGIDRLLKRRNPEAEVRLNHALERNPRSRIARLFMLEIELRSGNARRAASNMTILARLIPDVQTLFVPELARLARDPQTSAALAEALRSDPNILQLVLQHLAAKGAPTSTILRLAGSTPPVPTDPDAPDWRRTLLEAMVRKGDLANARLLWARFAGINAEDAKSAVYDGDFKGRPGLPPFNWAFSSSEIGAAERDKSGALQVEYYGRNAGDLGSQLIMLPAGQYRMSFHAEGDLNTPQHRLIWRIQCHPRNVTIAELPIANVTYAGRTVSGVFTIPARCPAQWLKLAGVPTEFPKNESVLIRNLRIQRIGGAS